MTCSRAQDDEDAYDVVVERWVLSTHASLELRVAGLRFLMACLDCWLFNYPLTDAPWIETLGQLATEGLADAPLTADPPPATREALLTEAQHSYALGEEITRSNATS